MKHYFFKYQGAGNDFILIDDRKEDFPSSDKNLIQRMCTRRFGIGSDGIMLIRESDIADVKLDFINPDGSRSFCGNGSRCGIRFAHSLKMIGHRCTFEAVDGVHDGELRDDAVRISMSDVEQLTRSTEGVILDTGSPHLVQFCSDVDKEDLIELAHEIRYSPRFQEEGINVNIVQIMEDGQLKMRTYERGVEGETLSCGTGVTAAALARAWNDELVSGEIKVSTRGGILTVEFQKHEEGFENTWLTGTALEVFRGEMEL